MPNFGYFEKIVKKLWDAIPHQVIQDVYVSFFPHGRKIKKA
jgi:hypothetical protein